MKLYHAPGTRALRPRWLLEELDATYELVSVDMASGEHTAAAYQAIHPLGTVPALDIGGAVLLESAAMCLHLADRFPDRGLAPPAGSIARAQYFQWIAFTTATVEPRAEAIIAARLLRGTMEHSDVAAAQREFTRAADVVAAVLAQQRYLAGDTFTAADIVLCTTLRWVHMFRDRLCPIAAPLVDYVDRLTSRPAFQRAVSD